MASDAVTVIGHYMPTAVLANLKITRGHASGNDPKSKFFNNIINKSAPLDVNYESTMALLKLVLVVPPNKAKAGARHNVTTEAELAARDSTKVYGDFHFAFWNEQGHPDRGGITSADMNSAFDKLPMRGRDALSNFMTEIGPLVRTLGSLFALFFPLVFARYAIAHKYVRGSTMDKLMVCNSLLFGGFFFLSFLIIFFTSLLVWYF